MQYQKLKNQKDIKEVYFVLPWYWNAARVEFPVKLIIRCVQTNAFYCTELFYIQNILCIDSSRIGTERRS